ncbi:unnamed protein product, partial [Pocillopora meandrina]
FSFGVKHKKPEPPDFPNGRLFTVSSEDEWQIYQEFLFGEDGKEYELVGKWHKRTVHVTLIADDTVEITENNYHICLASLHASEDNVLPFEEPEIDAEDDLDEREYESNRPKRSKRMTATACDFVYY